MAKLFSSFLFLFSMHISFAQNSNFGIINYSVPAGYELIKNDHVLTYYKEDKSTGTYCNLFIYKIMPGKGNVQQDFDFAWSYQLQKPFKITASAKIQPVAVLKGWQFLTGNATYADNGVSTLAILASFSHENNMQTVCILSNSDKYKNDIESFIASVDVAGEIAKYEVWECNCLNLSSNTQLTTKLNTVILSSDGKCLYHMPEKGLNGVTPANSNQDGSWGNVTNKENMLSLINDKYGKMELYKLTPTSMSQYPNSKSSVYKKVKPVDGLRFEGAFSPELSYYNGKTDIISRLIDPNKRPIIFFKKDGSYINEGIEFSNITLGDGYAIGKGTYEISNYSLILTTLNGRKLQVAFTPLLDANPTAADNPGFIINNNLFYRLGKNFVPHN